MTEFQFLNDICGKKMRESISIFQNSIRPFDQPPREIDSTPGLMQSLLGFWVFTPISFQFSLRLHARLNFDRLHIQLVIQAWC